MGQTSDSVRGGGWGVGGGTDAPNRVRLSVSPPSFFFFFFFSPVRFTLFKVFPDLNITPQRLTTCFFPPPLLHFDLKRKKKMMMITLGLVACTSLVNNPWNGQLIYWNVISGLSRLSAGWCVSNGSWDVQHLDPVPDPTGCPKTDASRARLGSGIGLSAARILHLHVICFWSIQSYDAFWSIMT